VQRPEGEGRRRNKNGSGLFNENGKSRRLIKLCGGRIHLGRLLGRGGG